MAKVRKFIEQHFEKALQRGYIPMFAAAAKAYDFPLALVMAIASRETNMTNMKGDYRFNKRLGRKVYNGYGIMQVDINTDENWCLSGKWANVADAIMHGVKILDEKRDRLNQIWKGERTLQQFLWTLAASYNTGADRAYPNFKASGNPDATTTGHDYGRDVLGRMVEFNLLLKERGLDVAAAKVIPAAAVTPDIDDESTWQVAPVPATAIPVGGQPAAPAGGGLVIQTGEENTVTGGTVQPVAGGGKSDPVQVLPTTEVKKEAWYNRMWSAILGFFALVGISLNEVWYGAKSALSDNPTALIISVLVVVGIVAIVWKIQDNRTQKEENDKQRAHERDMANLKALQDPKQINVAAVPANQAVGFMQQITAAGKEAKIVADNLSLK
jgi:hypothetical protein